MGCPNSPPTLRVSSSEAETALLTLWHYWCRAPGAGHTTLIEYGDDVQKQVPVHGAVPVGKGKRAGFAPGDRSTGLAPMTEMALMFGSCISIPAL